MQANSNFAEIRYGRVTTAVVDSFRRPMTNVTKLTPLARTRLRQSQILRTDPPFKILREEKDCYLTETADHTFGWIEKTKVKFAPAKDYWRTISRPKTNALVRVPRVPDTQILRALKTFARTPYLWGGRTKKGADCSGFTQSIFFQLFGLLLPKNSREQKKYGVRVKRSEICPLDLVFFVHRTRGTSHVGLAFDGKIWHLCLDKNKLASEALADISRNYKYVTARRIIHLPHVK